MTKRLGSSHTHPLWSHYSSTDHPDLGMGRFLSPSGQEKKVFGEIPLRPVSFTAPASLTSSTRNPLDYPSPSPANSTTHEYIHSLYPSISTKDMRSFLESFSGGFRTRYYRSSTGAESSKWLFEHVTEIAKMNKKAKVEVRRFEHPWGQSSIIARFPAAGETKHGKKRSVVVVGAHQDSTNLLPFLPAPGGTFWTEWSVPSFHFADLVKSICGCLQPTMMARVPPRPSSPLKRSTKPTLYRPRATSNSTGFPRKKEVCLDLKLLPRVTNPRV